LKDENNEKILIEKTCKSKKKKKKATKRIRVKFDRKKNKEDEIWKQKLKRFQT